MKVDKGVCTNDPDAGGGLDEIKAQRYGAVFTTLLENKILAIKREAEEAELKKKKSKKKIHYGGGGGGVSDVDDRSGRTSRGIGSLLTTKRSKSRGGGGSGGTGSSSIFCIKRNNSVTETDLVTDTNENLNMCHISSVHNPSSNVATAPALSSLLTSALHKEPTTNIISTTELTTLSTMPAIIPIATTTSTTTTTTTPTTTSNVCDEKVLVTTENKSAAHVALQIENEDMKNKLLFTKRCAGGDGSGDGNNTDSGNKINRWGGTSDYKNKSSIKEKLMDSDLGSQNIQWVVNDGGGGGSSNTVQKSDTESIHSDRSRKITFKSDFINESLSIAAPISLSSASLTSPPPKNSKHLNDSYYQVTSTSAPSAAVSITTNPATALNSPQSSIIEIYVSDDSLKNANNKSSRKSSGSTETTFSYPSLASGLTTTTANQKKCSFNVFDATTARLVDSNERHRLRVLEAKSISAQCSPIFPRALKNSSTQIGRGIIGIDDYHSASGAIGGGNINIGLVGTPLKYLSRQYTSEDSANNTFTSFIEECGDLPLDKPRGSGSGCGGMIVGGSTGQLEKVAIRKTLMHTPSITSTATTTSTSATIAASPQPTKTTPAIIAGQSAATSLVINSLNSNCSRKYHHEKLASHTASAVAAALVQHHQQQQQQYKKDNESLSHGFISNFNQLTSNNNNNSINISLPVITTTTTAANKKLRTVKCDKIYKQSNNQNHHYYHYKQQQQQQHHRNYHQHSITSMHQQNQSPQQYENINTNNDNREQYNHNNNNNVNNGAAGSSNQLNQQRSFDNNSIMSEEECKRYRKKHKRGHRCSDPVLVYPSTNGLQQCILTMPPNQSLQLQYDEDILYDVSLQMDGDRNGDLEVMVPGHRKHKHRHHHHHHHHHHRHHNPNHKKNHKKKILVHDLDTQSVKVIDPDDLPQRARWTIIATACLLLIMCLLLVGVTLRMAPLIDDMGPLKAMDNSQSFPELKVLTVEKTPMS